ncbi:class I SAM-dependent methyltransferase, partial [Candidatus Poribacteria bacterium]|nr:class I SAM-dependent methyltransferase [Candidatus Poribacteria bacterium]
IVDKREEFLGNIEGDDVSFVASAIGDYLRGDHGFDTISISNALHHLEGVGDILRDLRRIANPNGVVIISEMYADDLTPPQQTQRDLHAMIARLHVGMGEYHRATYTRDEINGFLAGAGLGVLHAFDAPHDDAPVEKGTDGFAGRAGSVMADAYPDGAPPDVSAEYERLKARAIAIGVARPPQLTLVCAYR